MRPTATRHQWTLVHQQSQFVLEVLTITVKDFACISCCVRNVVRIVLLGACETVKEMTARARARPGD